MVGMELHNIKGTKWREWGPWWTDNGKDASDVKCCRPCYK